MSAPTVTDATPAAAQPAERDAADARDVEAAEAEGRLEDIGFGKAILVGSAAGIVLLTALCFAALQVVAAELGVVPNLGISIWVGAWGGLFLGGTVTVGRWSMRRGH